MWQPIQYTHQSIQHQSDVSCPKIRILFINTMHDYVTAYSSAISEQFINVISRNERISVDRLQGVMATFPMAYTTIKNNSYDLVVYMGHGENDFWWDGFLGFLWKNEWVKMFSDSIIYSVSCKTAKEYGQKFIDNGSKAYIGNTEVVFGAVNTAENPFGKQFARVFQTELLNLLMGESVEDVVNFAKREWEILAKKYRGMDTQMFDTWAKRAEFNGKHHTFLGNGNARLPAVITDTDDLNLLALNDGSPIFL